VFPDKEDSNWAYDEEAKRWYFHRFYSHQPELNIASAEVRDELAQIMGYWLEQGLAGFRIDAVPFLIEPTGLPEGAVVDPHKLVRDLRRYVCRRRGDAMLLGEVGLPVDQLLAFFGDEDGDELHMCFNYSLNQALWLALTRGDPAPLRDALHALPKIPDDCQWANFVRNHDELFLEHLSNDERTEVFVAFGPEEHHQLYGRGLRRRLPTMLDGDQRRIRMIYSLMFSLPGTPVLFYGEEIGMAENLDIEGRMSMRAPMQWSDDDHGGFTTGNPQLVRPLVGSPRWGPGEINVARQRRDANSLLNWMERLVRRRRESPEIGWGDATVLDVDEMAVLAHRCDWDGNALVAVHSFSERPLETTVPTGDADEAVDLFAFEQLGARDGRITVKLEPYGHRWFRLRQRDQRLMP
jgi:maltose alpha-D-glucosyltransferase/alpha-amylase